MGEAGEMQGREIHTERSPIPELTADKRAIVNGIGVKTRGPTAIGTLRSPSNTCFTSLEYLLKLQ